MPGSVKSVVAFVANVIPLFEWLPIGYRRW